MWDASLINPPSNSSTIRREDHTSDCLHVVPVFSGTIASLPWKRMDRKSPAVHRQDTGLASQPGSSPALCSALHEADVSLIDVQYIKVYIIIVRVLVAQLRIPNSLSVTTTAYLRTRQ